MGDTLSQVPTIWSAFEIVRLCRSDSVRSVIFSPDGRRAASGSADCTIYIWDVETGRIVLAPLEGHSEAVMSVASSPDGRHVASGSDDHTIPILGYRDWTDRAQMTA